MSREARSRVLLGLGIPLGAFLFLAAMILAFSRILLAVPEELAPWVALLFATNILVGCAVAATVRGTRGFVFLMAIVVVTIAGGGVAGAVLGERPVESLIEGEQAAPPSPPAAPPGSPAPGQSPGGAPPPPGQPGGGGGGGGAGQEPGAPVQLTAQGIAFSTSELALPAGGEDVVAFTNNDAGTPHNFALYTEQGGQALFQGDIVTGPASTEYRFPAPDPGTYHFQCDVHPTVMFGTATVG